MIGHIYYTSKIDPKNVKEALGDDCCLIVMQEKVGQFTRKEVWDLVLRPKDANVSGTT